MRTLDLLRIVDTETIFCDADKCSGMRDAALLYVDNDHVSTLGSKRMAPLVFDALDIPLQLDLCFGMILKKRNCAKA